MATAEPRPSYRKELKSLTDSREFSLPAGAVGSILEGGSDSAVAVTASPMFVVFFWIAAMMHLLVLPEGRMQRRPGMLEMKRIRCAPHIKGIKGGAARHPGEGNPSSILFRRVGSPGYGEGSSQGQKGAALAVYGDVAVPSLQRISL
jgi:hypothetical protein